MLEHSQSHSLVDVIRSTSMEVPKCMFSCRFCGLLVQIDSIARSAYYVSGSTWSMAVFRCEASFRPGEQQSYRIQGVAIYMGVVLNRNPIEICVRNGAKQS